MDNTLIRLARAEAKIKYDESNSMEGLLHSYRGAQSTQNIDVAALYARKIRNKLLEETDNQMAIDRLKLPTSTESTVESWLPFLESLGEVLSGDWAIYRQNLRDLPEQEGWPLNVQFPLKPGETQETSIFYNSSETNI